MPLPRNIFNATNSQGGRARRGGGDYTYGDNLVAVHPAESDPWNVTAGQTYNMRYMRLPVRDYGGSCVDSSAAQFMMNVTSSNKCQRRTANLAAECTTRYR